MDLAGTYVFYTCTYVQYSGKNVCREKRGQRIGSLKAFTTLGFTMTTITIPGTNWLPGSGLLDLSGIHRGLTDGSGAI